MQISANMVPTFDLALAHPYEAELTPITFKRVGSHETAARGPRRLAFAGARNIGVEAATERVEHRSAN
jgi:hypothetical protein